MHKAKQSTVHLLDTKIISWREIKYTCSSLVCGEYLTLSKNLSKLLLQY